MGRRKKNAQLYASIASRKFFLVSKKKKDKQRRSGRSNHLVSKENNMGGCIGRNGVEGDIRREVKRGITVLDIIRRRITGRRGRRQVKK